MEERHICHVTSVHKYNDVRIFKKECVSLATAGFKTSLICANSPIEEAIDGVQVYNVEIGNPSRLTRMRSAHKWLRSKCIEVNADIFHLHDPELLPLGVWLKSQGKKVVFDSHEDTAADILRKDHFPKFLRWFISKGYNFYEKKSVRSFDGLISVSEEITSSFNHPCSITIKNYPILSMFSTLSSEKEEPPYAIYVGGLTRIRGIREIIEAVGAVEGLRLRIAGAFDEVEYEQECRALPAWKKVDFLGFIPLEKVYEHLVKASIGFTMLHPTEGHVHSLPIKTFEYMAAGVPVVMTDIPYWQKLFSELGFFAKHDKPREVARICEFILKHKDEIERKVDSARSKVFSDFNWQSQAEKLISFYNHL